MMRNRLLAFSTLCIAGTVNSALFGGATGLLVGLASNILAADLQASWDAVAQRLQGPDAVLQNEDLAKAVGRAIAAVIAKVAKEKPFQDYQEPLRRLAQRAETRWTADVQTKADLEPLQEANLVRLFAVSPTEFNQVKALTPQLWADLLNTWQLQEPEVMRDAAVMEQVAERLHDLFPKALREVLKEDFATGGRAFGALALDLFGELCGTLQEQQNAILARLDQLDGVDSASLEREFQQATERLETLSVGNETAFQSLSGQIESGFENIAQLLAELGIQLAGAEGRIRDDIQQLGKKLDGWERPVLTVSVVIDTSRPQVSHWQGRAEELKTLRHQLERVSLVGIPGLGGYGKSALANHLYETSHYPTKIWVTLSQPYRFSELGRWLLGKFGLQVEERVEDEALATALTNCLAEQRSLVVLDNLETLLDEQGQWLLPGYRSFFLKWLEYGSGSKILVTSREQPQLPSRNSYWYPALAGLKMTEGAALLRDYGIVGDEATLQEFVALADGHPLLLGLAAALLQDELGENPDIAGLKTPELNLFEIVGLHRGDPEASVNKLFAASFERLEERLQRLLCCVSVYRLPFNAAAAAVMLKETALTWQAPATQQQIERDLRHLAKRSLLQEAKRNIAIERRFQFLPLIASYVQRQQCDWAWAHEQAVVFYQATQKEKHAWETDEDLREYFEAFHHYCELQQFALADNVLVLCNNFLSLRGYNRTRVQLNERLVEGWQPSNSQDWSDFSWALTRLGNAYYSLGDYTKAIDYHKQSLKINREIGDCNGESAPLGNLGNAYYSLGDYAKAIDYYEQSLKINREIGDHNGEGNALGNLGNAYYSLGDYTKAIDYHEQSLKIKREIGDRNGEGNSLIGLGNAYYSLGDYTKAIDYHEQSLKIKREIGDRNGQGNALGNLGNAYYSLGDYAKVIDYYEQHLKISHEIGDRNGEGNALGNLGNAYYSLGDYAKAIDYYEQSLKIKHEIGNRNGEANAWFNLGNTLAEVDRVPDAIEAYRNARKLFAEMQLKSYVQRCDNAIQPLSSFLDPP